MHISGAIGNVHSEKVAAWSHDLEHIKLNVRVNKEPQN